MMTDALSRLLVPGTPPEVVSAYASFADKARDAVFGFEDEIAIVDIETTGFNPERDRIIEVAAAIVRGPEVLERFATLVDPGCALPAETTKLTGISDGDVAGAPIAEAAAVQLAEFMGRRAIVAHNASFDRAFLTRVGGSAAFPGPWLDSLQLARIALPRLRSHRLRDLADAFDAREPSHRAADDVEALAHLWRVMLCGLDALPPALVHHLASLDPTGAWPLRAVLAHHAGGRRARAFDLRELRRALVSASRVEPFDDADDVACSCPPVERLSAEFAKGGIASRMYEGFEERAEQTRMAEAVLSAFGTRTHAAIEAGTGVGKSVAYLVPAALFALENRVPVGVVTKTNSLTDQLVYSELPKLASTLDEELVSVSLKGYDHYLCLRKLERFAGELEEADEEVLAAVGALHAWAAQSAWGDLDGINLHWRRDVRAALQATRADCTRKRCRFFPNLCYLHGARRQAACAHIVVTNHALLFCDVVAAGGILPPIRYWIVDEAHAAEAEARDQLTLGASHAELASVLGALHSSRGGALDGLRRALRAHGDATAVLGVIARMEEAVVRAGTLSDSLFDFVKDLAALSPESGYDSLELRLTPELRESGSWGTVAGVARSLGKRLEALLADGRELVTLLEAEDPETLDARADLVGLLSRLAEQHAGLVAVLDGESDEFVYSAAIDRRRTVDAEQLRAARLDVGEVLAEEFFPRTHSVVFTSATIAAGDDFSHFARAIGLDRLPPESWTALRLASSYDFDRQMSVFAPTDIAPPGTREYLGDLERFLEAVHLAMGGSVLTLFTNRREMEALFEVLAPRLEAAGVSVLVQGRGTSAKRLRDEFLADERLSLFATKSFWEGFDAKGDTLRCVVIPKLPFGQMNDPLYAERRERDPRAWAHYYLPEAIIELKQAAGRLIRSKTDTGCLVIADSRVSGPKRYGPRFLEALPVADVEMMSAADVVAAIERRFGRLKV